MVVAVTLLVITVILFLEQHLLTQGFHVPVLVVDGDLEFHVHGIQELAVILKYLHLLRLAGGIVIHIREQVAFAVAVACHFKDAVRCDPQKFNAFLYAFRGFV